MLKRILILIALIVVMAAITLLQYDSVAIEIPFFGIVSMLQLLTLMLFFIAATLAVTLFAGLISCGR